MPLSYTAGKGRKAIVKLLKKRGDVEADSTNQNDRTPLSYAAGKEYEAIIKLLFKLTP
jgi:ankyrin repeat protein